MTKHGITEFEVPAGSGRIFVLSTDADKAITRLRLAIKRTVDAADMGGLDGLCEAIRDLRQLIPESTSELRG
jgi:hypothetical protein